MLRNFLASDDRRGDWLHAAVQLGAAQLDAIWQAVVASDATVVERFIAGASVAAGPLKVDFGRFRGSYEARIFTEGVMPVRPASLHDFFNLVAWNNFPRTKSTINQLHFENMTREHNGKRGPRRDFLTILDEAGVVLFVRQGTDPQVVADQLRALRVTDVSINSDRHHDSEKIIEVLDAAGAKIAIVGHALMETLVARPETMRATGAFAIIIPENIHCAGSGLVDLPRADRALSEYLVQNSELLKPSLFPSLRLDVVFQFIGKNLAKAIH